MTLDEFLVLIESKHEPESLSGPLRALWFDKKGYWDRAHQLVQQIHTVEGSWVHAYLHREEGDLWNARYWYNRAGRPESSADFETEWREIAESLTDT